MSSSEKKDSENQFGTVIQINPALEKIVEYDFDQLVEMAIISLHESAGDSRLIKEKKASDDEKASDDDRPVERTLANLSDLESFDKVNSLSRKLLNCKTLSETASAAVQLLEAEFGLHSAVIWLGGDCLQKSSAIQTGRCKPLKDHNTLQPLTPCKAQVRPRGLENIAQNRELGVWRRDEPKAGILDPAWAEQEGVACFVGLPLVDSGESFGVLGFFASYMAPSHRIRIFELAANVIAAALAKELQRQEAKFASQMKSNFLANMSHEIRTPMTAILGYSENLQDSEISEKEKNIALGAIKHSGKHLLEIINSILDMSRIESGKMKLERMRCYLLNLIAEVWCVAKLEGEKKNLQLFLELEELLPETIITDPTKLRQILINLLDNAMKFTKRGEVRLRVKPLSNNNGPMLQFDVIDTGIGVSPDKIDSLFDPFTQADESLTRQYGGTGLGLAVSKCLAELLEGDIEVQSELGKGSRFRLLIPIGSTAGVAKIKPPADLLSAIAPSQRGVAPATDKLDAKILLADDCPENQRLISLLLKKAGAEVAIVGNGQLAVEAVLAAKERGKVFDVILMDVQMPVLDGLSATRIIRQAKYTGPIISVTANVMDGDREKCLEAGCDDYLPKPIDRRSLLAMTAKWATAAKSNG